MTLEQAINHLEEELKNKQDWSCVACKEEHEQLLEWLKELQAIKNAKPSEALSAFRSVELTLKENRFLNEGSFLIDNLNTIKNYILKAQEQEKVLSIIIKKNVSVWGFRNRVFGYQKEQNGNKIINDTYEYYLYHFGCYHNGFDIELLTEEEFNTLKEYFK